MATVDATPVGKADPSRVGGDVTDEVLSEIVPEFRSGAWRLVSSRIVEARPHHGRRIVYCQVSCWDTSDNRAKTLKLVAKVYYRGDRGARSMSSHLQLWEAGFPPPARYQVPRLYGYSGERGVLVQAAASGMSWFDFLRGRERALSVASAGAAGWLVRLQRSHIIPEARGEDAGGAVVERQIRDLSSAFPLHAPRLEAVGERLVRRLQGEGILLVPSHGDYHPKNVFLTPGSTTAIDLDLFGLREAAFDAGYAVSALLVMSHYHLEDLTPGARAALAFWQAYQPEGQLTWPRLAAQVARSFLQTMHYGLYAMRGNRPQELELWPAWMEAWLDSDGPGILERVLTNGRVFPLSGARPARPGGTGSREDAA